MNDREKWVRAVGGYDLLDRRRLRHLDVPDYLLLVARIDPARVRQVPPSAIPEDGRDDEGEFAFVSCPCGAKPIVRERLERCSGCERYYTLVWPRVFVTYGNVTPPPLGSAPGPFSSVGSRIE